MKRCKNCFEYKPLEAYQNDKSYPDGHKATCKVCRAVRRRQLSYRMDNKVTPIGQERGEAYLAGLFRRAAKEDLVNVPVRTFNNYVVVENGCQFKVSNGRKRCFMRTLHGEIDFPFDVLNPKLLLELMDKFNLLLILPGDHYDT